MIESGPCVIMCHRVTKCMQGSRLGPTCFLQEKATSGRLTAYFPTRSSMREYSSAALPRACEGNLVRICKHASLVSTGWARRKIALPFFSVQGCSTDLQSQTWSLAEQHRSLARVLQELYFYTELPTLDQTPLRADARGHTTPCLVLEQPMQRQKV